MSNNIDLGKLIYPECAKRIELFNTQAEAEECAERVSRIGSIAVAFFIVIVAVIIYISSESMIWSVVMIMIALVILFAGPRLSALSAGRQWLAAESNIQTQLAMKPGLTRYDVVQNVIQQAQQQEMLDMQNKAVNTNSTQTAFNIGNTIGLFGNRRRG